MKERIRALVADDYASLRELLKCVLEHQDVEVCTAVHGADALAQAKAGSFDMIFMDMDMPVMDGLTAVKLIREHEAVVHALPATIVMVSAHGEPGIIDAARQAGVDRHVLKPFSIDEFLLERLGVQLRRPAVAEQAG